MTEQEINNLIDSKFGKVKMSQLPETDKTGGLYSIGYIGNQSVKYKSNLLQGDPLTVRKTYQTEALALADKNPIDATTSLPLKVGQFVSIVDDGEKNGIYRIGSIGGDGTMSLELQGKLGDLSDYAKKGGSTKTLKEVDDEKAEHGYASIEVAKTLKQVEDNASVKIKNEAVNGNFENGLIEPFNVTDGGGGASTLAINSSTPISGNYDIRLTIITPATDGARPIFQGVQGAGNIGDKIYLHFYAKILSGTPKIRSISDGGGANVIYGGDVINGRNTRIIDVVGTGSSLGVIYFRSQSVWDMQMDNFMRINLTETFGAGNEPTKEEMDLLISTLGTDYFEEEITIPAQKIWQKQLKIQDDLTQLAGDLSDYAKKIEVNETYIKKDYLLETGKNLFNINSENNVLGSMINLENGHIEPSEVYNASHYISIDENTTYSLTENSRYFSWYDKDMNFLLGNNESVNVITSPPLARYVRFSIRLSYWDSFQIEEGSTSTSYEPYKTIFKPNFNWFINDREYANSNGGSITSSPSYKRTNFLKLPKELTYSLEVRFWASAISFYDKNKVYISSIDSDNATEFTIIRGTLTREDYPENAYYFIASTRISHSPILIYNLPDILPEENLDDASFNWFINDGERSNVSDGSIVSSPNYKRTNYLKLPEKIEYSLEVRATAPAIAFYDDDKNYISSINSDNASEFTVLSDIITREDYPENAYYFIATTNILHYPTLNFNFPDVLPEENKNLGDAYIPLPKSDIIYASHFSGVMTTDRGNPVIPEMSIWSLQVAKRMGYKYVQCNAALTSDGQRIMQHDIPLRTTMTDLSGNLLDASVRSTDLTLEYIKNNFKYKSTIPKFRTSVLEMKEYLRICREYGIIPLFNNTTFSEAEYDSIVDIVGNKFGIFATERQFPSKKVGHIVHAWRSVAETPEVALSKLEKIGQPVIYGAHANSWTKELSDALQANGYLRNVGSVYNESPWADMKKYADFNVTDIFTNPTENYDSIISSDRDWDDFITTGEVVDGLMILEIGETLSYESDEVYWLAKMVLSLTFNGSLKISCGNMNPENIEDETSSFVGGELNWVYSRDESDPSLDVTPSLVDGKVKMILTATEKTTIYSTSLKITKV